MSNAKIPVPVIAVVAEVLSDHLTHSYIDLLMESVGVPGTPPVANKLDKVRGWLKRLNSSSEIDAPLDVFGKVLEEYMEADSRSGIPAVQSEGRKKIEAKLRQYGLTYVKGGHIAQSGVATVSKTLQDVIQARDLAGLQIEFDRILKNVESDPAAAITSSCALLESLFQVYIGDHCCPAKSRIESTDCRCRISRYRSWTSEVPVKWAFSQKE